MVSRSTEQLPELVKENVVWREPLSARALCVLCALAGGALLLAARLDAALPAPRPAGNDTSFSGQAAHAQLRNLTAIGPRVAGSYENEVWAVRVLVEAVRAAAAGAAPHNVVELDRHEGSGAFSLTFFDGMNNVYRGVQSVLARVRARGERSHALPALLLNCHFDTVPDSPGASDDGAGCAVLLEVLRALAAEPRPLRRPVLFLFNGAEENIMQGSHAFVSGHKWARAVRAFLNLEACGAGGREVLFQAGPHDPWLVEAYAGAVPHPFASSLAQELFESGLLPGDTDFRVFRDFGNLSGLDFAWSSNGYVYHTALDTAERVPAAALQRTGDNVLALTRGLLAGSQLESAADATARQPVFFDILGVWVVSARAPLALLVALATVALVLCNVHAHAGQARRQLYMARGWWWRCALRAAAVLAAGGAAGVLAAAAVGGALCALGARLAFYDRDWLLAPLAVLPALAVSWAAVLGAPWPAPLRGWWRARALRDGAALLSALMLLGCCAARLRSGFLPLLWTLLPAAADRAALPLASGPRALLWVCGAALPALQTWYLLLALLATLLPVAGRAGTPPLPPDVLVLGLTSALSLAATGWLLPFVAATRRPHVMVWCCALLAACCALLVAGGPLYAPYGAARPQRLMVFHVRRTLHGRAAPQHEDLFWVPELDGNTARSLRDIARKLGTTVSETPPAECARWVYCGAPYYLPVRGLVARAHRLPARSAPGVRLAAHVALRAHNDSHAELTVSLTGPNHVVLIVSPTAGTELRELRTDAGALRPLRAARWHEHARDTYFTSLFSARPAALAAWNVTLLLARERAGAGAGAGTGGPAADGARWASLSLSGHAMAAGRRAWGAEHRALAAAAHPHAAVTGWAVHTHLYTV